MYHLYNRVNIIKIHHWAPSSLCRLWSDIRTEEVDLVLRFVQTCFPKDMHIGILNEAVVAVKPVKVSLYEVPVISFLNDE